MITMIPEDVLLAAIATVAGVPGAALVSTTKLTEIGIDSMKFTEVLLEVERRMAHELPADVVERIYAAPPIETVEDLVRALA